METVDEWRDGRSHPHRPTTTPKDALGPRLGVRLRGTLGQDYLEIRSVRVLRWCIASDGLLNLNLARSDAFLDAGTSNLVQRLGRRAPEWTGWTPGIKPALEPIVVARKPMDGTVVDTVLAYGTGALNVGATRVPFANAADEAETKGKNQHGDYGTLSHSTVNAYGDFSMLGQRSNYDSTGRLISNLMLDDHQAQQLDAQSGTSRSIKGKPRSSAKPGQGWGSTATGAEYDDAGGASRFFHVYPATPDDLAQAAAEYAARCLDELDSRVLWQAKAPSKERPVVAEVRHPTVKPIELMRTLLRLVVPPGGVVLEPFAGSGTTIEAAMLEGFDVLACESHEPYLALIHHRINRAQDLLAPARAA